MKINLPTAIVVAAGLVAVVAATYLKLDPKAIAAMAGAFITVAGSMESVKQ